MEYTLQSTGRNGYLTVLRSRALTWAICTAGLRVAFLTNKEALTMVILYSLAPADISANEGLLRTSGILTSTPLIRNLSCRNKSTWSRTNHVDHATAGYVISSSHEPSVGCGSAGQLDGVHATRRVLTPQLIRQLRRLGVGSVTQQRLYVGSIRLRVGRRGHERTVQGDVDLTPQRIQPVVHRSDGFGRIEIVSVDSRHLRLHV